MAERMFEMGKTLSSLDKVVAAHSSQFVEVNRIMTQNLNEVDNSILRNDAEIWSSLYSPLTDVDMRKEKNMMQHWNRLTNAWGSPHDHPV